MEPDPTRIRLQKLRADGFVAYFLGFLTTVPKATRPRPSNAKVAPASGTGCAFAKALGATATINITINGRMRFVLFIVYSCATFS